MKHTTFLRTLLGVAGSLLLARNSSAEGNINFGEGANGVNRVVRTNLGFTGVSVRLDELSFSMPRNEAGLFERVDAQNNPILSNGNGTLDLLVQPFPRLNGLRPQGNKPSAYLGGSFHPAVRINTPNGQPVRTQVDVGLQYEPVTLSNVGAGWSVFFYLHNVGHISPHNGNRDTDDRLVLNPRVLNPAEPANPEGIAYRSSGSSTNGTMNLDARQRGSLGFTFSRMGNIFFNLQRDALPLPQRARWQVSAAHPAAPWGDDNQPPLQVFNTNLYNEADVKRVTAMTRDNPYSSELDGSRVTARWSLAQVRPFNGVLRTWGDDDVNDAVTGYDAPGEGDFAWDKRYQGRRTPFSKTIVQFSQDEETNIAMRAGIHDANRYAAEDVTINLGTLTRPLGNSVQ